jgi:hypothetical protein
MSSDVQLYIYTLMGLSAIVGGCLALMVRMGVDHYKRRQKQGQYNPWEVQGHRVVYHEPMPHLLEQPISARKK